MRGRASGSKLEFRKVVRLKSFTSDPEMQSPLCQPRYTLLSIDPKTLNPETLKPETWQDSCTPASEARNPKGQNGKSPLHLDPQANINPKPHISPTSVVFESWLYHPKPHCRLHCGLNPTCSSLNPKLNAPPRFELGPDTWREWPSRFRERFADAQAKVWCSGKVEGLKGSGFGGLWFRVWGSKVSSYNDICKVLRGAFSFFVVE